MALFRTDYPKQFLTLSGELSLLQQTVARFKNADVGAPLVVCSERHRFLTAEQLLAMDVYNATIMLESCARNTAPAIAVAAWHLVRQNPDAVMVVLPADHLIEDTEAFLGTVSNAIVLAQADQLVTLGVAPRAPETGYGYIESGEQIGGSTDGRKVVKFIEKPDIQSICLSTMR